MPDTVRGENPVSVTLFNDHINEETQLQVCTGACRTLRMGKRLDGDHLARRPGHADVLVDAGSHGLWRASAP